MQNIYWKGFSSGDRNATIPAISDCINRYGFLADFKHFSDLSMSIIIEVEERYVDDLFDALGQYLQMDAHTPLQSSSTKERTILFNLTFTKGTGDFKTEIPDVPG